MINQSLGEAFLFEKSRYLRGVRNAGANLGVEDPAHMSPATLSVLSYRRQRRRRSSRRCLAGWGGRREGEALFQILAICPCPVAGITRQRSFVGRHRRRNSPLLKILI